MWGFCNAMMAAVGPPERAIVSQLQLLRHGAWIVRHTDVTSTNTANLANVVRLRVAVVGRAVDGQALDRVNEG